MDIPCLQSIAIYMSKVYLSTYCFRTHAVAYTLTDATPFLQYKSLCYDVTKIVWAVPKAVFVA